MATSPDLDAVRPIPLWRVKAGAFWRWWSGELLHAMPERLVALRGGARLPQLAFEGGEIVLVEPRAAAGPDSRVAVETMDAARGRAAVHALLERAGEMRGRARAGLAHHEALVRRVTMPAATEENLRQVLAFEMDRLTPFRADEVYFDFRVLSRDATAGTILVLIAVARRDFVDAAVERLRALGVSVQGVSVRDDASGAAAPLDLLPSEQRGERETARERMVRTILIVAVLALLAAALLLPVWRKRQAVIALLPQVNKAAAEAQATDGLAREVEKQVNDYNFLLGKKYGSPPALAYVEDVSRLLPDTTWVQQLDIKQTGKVRELQITGETPSSSRLIEVLEQSQLLRNSHTMGTVTRGSQPNTERFMIAAETRPLPPPEPRPLLEGAPPPAGTAAPAPAPATPPAAAPKPAAAAPVPAKVEPVPAKPDTKAPAKPAPGK